MLQDIQKLSFSDLRQIFSPLNAYTDYVFWIRSRDMGKQIFTSDSYKIIWERDIDVIFDLPLAWLDYLASENRHDYMRQLQARHEQGYLKPEKNIALYQITTPSNRLRYLLDRCYRCEAHQGEHYIVGIAKSISADSWAMQYENEPENFSEEDEKVHQDFFRLLKKEFGIIPLNIKKSALAKFSDNNDFLAELQNFGLSKRELECLAHICQGKTYKQAAKEMQISPRTVETYLENILSKTSCSTKLELISQFSRAFR